MIQRDLIKRVERRLKDSKVLIIIGPRQVGKTTLIQNILKNKEHLFLDGDDPLVRRSLDTANTEQLKQLIGTYPFVYIDEAQRIQNIGLTLKIIHDQLQPVKLLVTGTSAFELGNETTEPLTGRKWEFKLYPISWNEFENNVGFLKAQQQLETRLLYGMYPDVVNNLGDEEEILQQLTDSYLFKDILAYGGIRKPELLDKLVRALAYQIGNEVSYNELSRLVGIDKNTVRNYIDLLEQACVIFKLPSFNKNLRSEIKTNQKIYFVDLGVRNAIINDFKPMDERPDKGAIWENFLIIERLKEIAYKGERVRSFFWRTRTQQKVDYVEEKGNDIKGYEFKWSPKSKVKIPKSFIENYDSTINVFNNENFRTFLK